MKTKVAAAADGGTILTVPIILEGIMERNFPDGFTRDGAYRLVRTIKLYWNARMKYPQVWVEQQGDIYVVRSNLTGGKA